MLCIEVAYLFIYVCSGHDERIPSSGKMFFMYRLIVYSMRDLMSIRSTMFGLPRIIKIYGNQKTYHVLIVLFETNLLT